MAKVEVTAFVSDWKFGETQPNPSWAMKVSESHSKKDGDKWVKVGSTNFTVKAAYGVNIDFSAFRTGDRVKIIGTQVSESWESNGKKGKSLVIKADDVVLMAETKVQQPVQVPDNWTLVDDGEAPFC